MTSEREQILLEVFLAVAGPGWEKVMPELLEGGRAEAGTVPAITAPQDMPAAEALQRAVTETAGAWRESGGETRPIAGAAPRAAEAVKTAAAPAQQSANKTGEQRGSSVWSKVASATSLGTLPLARAIIGLFTGGGTKEPEPLVRFALPRKMKFEAAVADGRITSVDYDQYGLPRAGRAQAAASEARTEAAASARAMAPQVTVQVQAMDSRSFMDRSEDIARAVREAMLNMHALNDVVGEL
ncbi:MAG: hypothetical protein ACE15B_19850 [Bryobacteraceae bacterium]